MKPLAAQPILIDQVYESLVEAIADGSLPAEARVRQEEIAERLGVSRQPVSHALQLLKRQGLLQETGRRGLIVAPIDPARILHLYQVRTALDGLAARLAAERVAQGSAPAEARAALERALAEGTALGPEAPPALYIQADVAFHRALYRLSGNPAIEETVAAQWPHLKRAMGAALTDAGHRPLIWREHA